MQTRRTLFTPPGIGSDWTLFQDIFLAHHPFPTFAPVHNELWVDFKKV